MALITLDFIQGDVLARKLAIVGTMRRALHAFSDPREQKKLPPSIFFLSRISHSVCEIVDFPVPAIPTSMDCRFQPFIGSTSPIFLSIFP
jgi:hypothetical protein